MNKKIYHEQLFSPGNEMKKSTVLLSFLIFLFSFSSTLFGSRADKNYAFGVVKKISRDFMEPLDLNGDGIDEFIIKTNDRQIDVQDFDFKKFYFSITVPTGKYAYFIPFPTSSLDSLNLFYYHWSEDSAVYDFGISTKDTTIFQQKCVVFTGKDKDRDGRFDNSLHYEGLIKNRKNERKLI